MYRLRPTLLLVFLAACPSSTRITDAWVAPDTGDRAMGRTLVLGLTDRLELRDTLERELARALRAQGVDAEPAGDRLPPGETPPPKAQVAEMLASEGFDSVLVVRPAGVRTDVTATPAPAVPAGPPAAAGIGSTGWWDYYDSAWTGAYRGDVLEASRVVTFETRLFDVPDAALVWSAWTDSFDPAQAEDLAVSLGEALVGRLEADGLLGR